MNSKELLLQLQEKQESSVWGNTFKLSQEECETLIGKYVEERVSESVTWLLNEYQKATIWRMEAELVLIRQRGIFDFLSKRKRLIAKYFKKYYNDSEVLSSMTP
jgi:hypothetical protein